MTIAGVAWGLAELRYVNWEAVVAPVDALPLEIRQDVKGDGHFRARRSGGLRHTGIDLAAPLGSPVRAIRSGTVLRAETHRGRGHYIDLMHDGDLTSRYAHLRSMLVEVGERVRQGEVIGTIGKTGNARHPSIVPHLHLEVAKAGAVIDPATIGLEVLTGVMTNGVF